MRRRIARIGIAGVLFLLLIDLPVTLLMVYFLHPKPAHEMTPAERQERHDAVALCRERTIGDAEPESAAYFAELDRMRDCMLGFGLHVRVVDEPATHSFNVEFENTTDR